MKRPNTNLRNIELTQRFIKRQVVVEIVRVLVMMVVMVKVAVIMKKKCTSGESELFNKQWC